MKKLAYRYFPERHVHLENGTDKWIFEMLSPTNEQLMEKINELIDENEMLKARVEQLGRYVEVKIPEENDFISEEM